MSKTNQQKQNRRSEKLTYQFS